MENNQNRKGMASLIYTLVILAILSGCAMTINVITKSNNVDVESSQNGEMKNDSNVIKDLFK